MKKFKIYVASSWKNTYQPGVVALLRTYGHTVYDFKNPPDSTGFSWSEIDPHWGMWGTMQYQAALEHPRSIQGFNSDFNAMLDADICVLVLPSGRSAHTEAGYMAGAMKKVIAFIPEPQEAELMYKIFDHITGDEAGLINIIEQMSRIAETTLKARMSNPYSDYNQ